jgi:hypothetical protein
MDSPSGADLMAAESCIRCKRKVLKSGTFEDRRRDYMGAVFHDLCWRIEMSKWVMTQDNREEALAFVDSIIGKPNY